MDDKLQKLIERMRANKDKVIPYNPNLTPEQYTAHKAMADKMKAEQDLGNLRAIEPLPDLTFQKGGFDLYPEKIQQQILDAKSNDARLRQMEVPDESLDMYRRRLEERIATIKNKLSEALDAQGNIPQYSTPEKRPFPPKPEFY